MKNETKIKLMALVGIAFVWLISVSLPLSLAGVIMWAIIHLVHKFAM